MSREIIRIKKDDIGKLDPASFLDIDRIEQELLVDTVIYVAFESGEPAGIITLEPVGSIYRTSYFFVPQKYRRQGIFRDMMQAVKSYDPKIYINDDMPGYSMMLSVFEHMDIGVVRDIWIYTFEKDAGAKEFFAEVKSEHAGPVLERLADHGFAAISMSEASLELYESLGDEMGSGYDEDKNPENVKNLARDWSYIVSGDGEAAAFIACVLKKDVLNIEMFSAHKKYRGSGVALLALFTVIDRAMQDNGIKKVMTGVMEENEDAVRLIEGKLSGFLTEKKQMKVFEIQ